MTTMTTEQAEHILRNAAGNPTNGPVADIIPTMAAAISDALKAIDKD